MLAKDTQATQATQASSIVPMRHPKMSNVNTSMSTLPYSRERMIREKSELSFTAGRRQPLNSTESKRILGEKGGFIHSSLSSVLGRESRVLRRIYERVQNLERKAELGNKRDQVQQKATLLSNARQKLSGTRTAGSRVPFSKEYSIKAKAGSNLEPVNILSESAIDLSMPRIYNEASSTTLVDPVALLPSPEIVEGQLPQVVVVETNTNPVVGLSDQMNTDKEGRMITTMQGERQEGDVGSSDLVQQTADFSERRTLISKNPSSSYLPRGAPSRASASENTRIENKKVLHEYKQRKLLVDNLQLNKLIKKDMNMFESDRTRKRVKRKSTLDNSRERVPSI